MTRALPLSMARLSHNALWLMLGRVLAQALAVLATALMARRFGADGFGQFAWVGALVFVANVFTTFGTDSLLIREIARTRRTDGALLPGALWLQGALSALCIVPAAVYAVWQPSPVSYMLALYSLSLLPLAPYSVVSAVLRGQERMDRFMLLSVAGALAQAAAALWAYAAQLDLLGLFALLLIGQMLIALVAASLTGFAAPSARMFRVAPGVMAGIARAALPFAMLAALGILYQRAGVLVLPALSGDDVTGLFAADARIVEALKIVPQALLGALFPRWAGGGESPRAGTPLLLMLGYSAAAAALCTLVAQPLVELLYGDRFAAAAAALPPMAWSLVPYALGAHLSLGLIARRHEWAVAGATCAALVVALALFAALAPRAGLAGAAWAVLGGETAQAALFLLLWRAAKP
jgi:O-antigen/teichoic acid export membrane protein